MNLSLIAHNIGKLESLGYWDYSSKKHNPMSDLILGLWNWIVTWQSPWFVCMALMPLKYIHI